MLCCCGLGVCVHLASAAPHLLSCSTHSQVTFSLPRARLPRRGGDGTAAGGGQRLGLGPRLRLPCLDARGAAAYPAIRRRGGADAAHPSLPHLAADRTRAPPARRPPQRQLPPGRGNPHPHAAPARLAPQAASPLAEVREGAWKSWSTRPGSNRRPPRWQEAKKTSRTSELRTHGRSAADERGLPRLRTRHTAPPRHRIPMDTRGYQWRHTDEDDTPRARRPFGHTARDRVKSGTPRGRTAGMPPGASGTS